MSFWEGKRVLVAGGLGFIGSHVVRELNARDAQTTVADLALGPDNDLSVMDNARRFCQDQDVVINLGGSIGGIGEASQRHAEMFMGNLMLNLNLLEAARLSKTPRFVVVSSACVYSDDCPSPMTESWGHRGAPASSSLGYGLAKRIAELQGTMYSDCYGMSVAIARPFNAYGPGDRSRHVIPDILRKIDENPHEIEVWGGEQVRSFTYVSDWVDALLLISEFGPSGSPINLGGEPSGISIKDLVGLLLAIRSTTRSVKYVDGPEGHRERIPNLTWLYEIGWRPRISLSEGLNRTVEAWS